MYIHPSICLSVCLMYLFVWSYWNLLLLQPLCVYVCLISPSFLFNLWLPQAAAPVSCSQDQLPHQPLLVLIDPVKMIILAIIPINSIELFIPSCDVTQTWSIKYHLDTSDSQMLFPVYTSPKNLRTLYLLSFSVCLLSTRGNLCPHRSTVIPQIDP